MALKQKIRCAGTCGQHKTVNAFPLDKRGKRKGDICAECRATAGVLKNPNWGACPFCTSPMKLEDIARYGSCRKCKDDRKVQYLGDDCADLAFGALLLKQCEYCHRFFPVEIFRGDTVYARCVECRSRSNKIASLPREFYDRYEIAERDNWTCGICGDEIDPSVTEITDPGYLNIDHIIPVTHPKFPGDIRSNIQASHRVCNIRKGGFRY
jgi:hypothetical protein